MKWLVVVSMVFLSSCTHLIKKPVDKEALLNELKGPDVPTIDSSLAKTAEQAFTRGNYAKAASYYQQLVSKKKEDEDDNPDYLLGYAESLRLSGKGEQSQKVYDKVIESGQHLLVAKEGKALSYMNEGRFPEAVDLFSEVLTADNKRWKAMNAIGIAYALTNRPKEALPYLEGAYTYSDKNPKILNNLGLAYALINEMDRSITVLERASRSVSRQDKNRSLVDLNLALVYGIHDRLEDAERVAKEHLSEAELYNNMGFYAHLAKDEKLAKAFLNKALIESPVFYEKAWVNLEVVGE